MAYAEAEGARSAGATVDVKRVAGDRSRGGRQGGAFQARSTGADRDPRRAWELRRDHCGRADAFRPHALGDGQLLGAGGATLGERRPARKSRRGLHFERDPARRQRNDALFDHRQPDAFRPGDRRAPLQPRRPDDARGDCRRSALRRDHDRRWAGPAPADQDRARSPPASGRTDRKGRSKLAS